MLNEVFKDADGISLPVPAGTLAGSPIRFGILNGVTLTDEGSVVDTRHIVDGLAQPTGGIGNLPGFASVKTSGAFRLEIADPVTAKDTIYITPAGTLTATAEGNDPFGVAIRNKKVDSTDVLVRLIQPGEGGGELTPESVEANLPSRLSEAELSATFAPRWKPVTAYASGQMAVTPDGHVVRAREAFTSTSLFDSTKWEYGTFPGSSNTPVLKPSTDTRASVFEYVHDSPVGYLYHKLAGANMGHNAAIDAYGIDNDGIGALFANKKLGRGIVIDQKSTITSALAYGLHATQSSTLAPLMRLEQNVDGAAAALQLVAFGTPTASQHLAYFGDPNGEAGRILSANGKISWLRDIRIANQASGEAPSMLELSTSSAANSSNTKKSWHGSDHETFFGATGSAGVYYPYRSVHSASSWSFQTGANLTPADPLNPRPSDVSSWTTQFTIGNTGISFFGATKAKKTGWATATGTATRTTFDTTTVTLADLAQRVKALIDDLHSTSGYGLLQA